MIAIVSDIHIKLSRHSEFELGRLSDLAASLCSHNYSHIVLNGDLLDSSTPTLQEISAAQSFITKLSKVSEVILLSGNHEAVDIKQRTSVYDLVKMPDCDYVKQELITIEDRTINLVSWSHLSSLTYHEGADLLITHVRSDMPPHIKAERPMEFTEKYKLCILGDIHHKFSPRPNTHYTNSPYAVNFSGKSPNGSFIEVNLFDLSWSYIDLHLGQKVKFAGTVGEVLEQLVDIDDNNVYKCHVIDTIDNLRRLESYKNVSYRKIVKDITVDWEQENTSEPFIERLSTAVTQVMDKESGGDNKDTVDKILKELL